MVLTEEQKKERRKEYLKIYYQENKERIKEKQKEYSDTNKEYKNEYNKKYRKENKDKIKEKNKKYSDANKERIKEYRQTEQGKKSTRITNWKQSGVICDDFNNLYEYYINCCNCEECGIRLVEGSYGANKRCLDHDHKTGKFRNIICHICNTKRGYIDNNNNK